MKETVHETSDGAKLFNVSLVLNYLAPFFIRLFPFESCYLASSIRGK